MQREVLLLGLALALASFARAEGGSPVEKVVTMLEDVQTQVIQEGKEEAATYDKFACFCKDMTNDKTDAITEGQTSVEDLSALINTKSSERADLDSELEDLNTKITDWEAEAKEAKEKRAKEHMEYLKEKKDIKDGLSEIEAAKKQVVSEVASEADSGLGQEAAAKLIMFLVKLRAKFRKELNDMHAKEQRTQQEHDKDVLDLELQIGTAQKSVARAETRRAEVSKEISQANGDLTATLAQLHDDQGYLKDLTAKCEDKSKEWDQRSTMRQDELSALTEALSIIKGTVAANTNENTVRLLHVAAKTTKGAVVAAKTTKKIPAKPVVLLSAEEESDDDNLMKTIDDLSLLQVESSPRTRLSFLAKKAQSRDEPREKRLVALLRAKSSELKSTVLAHLASKVVEAESSGADPFAKIKQLVSELIERLMQEAADEGSHKGWCDKEIGNAKSKRAEKSEEVKSLNTQLELAETKRDKLAENIDTLTKEINLLTESLDETTNQRAAEKEQNAATVSEAEEGQAAVEQAIDVLDKFYKKAAKAEVEFVQERATTTHKGVDDDLPDTGFSGANKGSQGAATGIMGMLEVIKSDFVRTIKATEKAEKDAKSDFKEFKRTTKTSIKAKKTAKENDEGEKADTVAEIDEAKESLKEQQKLLDKALQELEELRPACIDTGMSYEERVSRREQEIEALNEALCILDKEGAEQTEPSCQ